MAKKKVIAKDPVKGFYVNLYSGEKGGVGKSWCAAMDAQRHIDRDKDFWLIDTDPKNTATGQRYADYLYPIEARLTEERDRLSIANAIFEAGIEKPTVVNCRASSNESLLRWLDAKYIARLAKQYDLKMRYLFVSDLELESLNQFEPTVNMFMNHLPVIFIANLGPNSTGTALFDSDGFQGLLEKYRVPVIQVKRFDVELKKKMEGQSPEKKILNWQQAKNYPGMGLIGQSEIEATLDDFYKQLDDAERLADLEFSNRTLS